MRRSRCKGPSRNQCRTFCLAAFVGAGIKLSLACTNRRAEDVVIPPIVISELELRDVQRQVSLIACELKSESQDLFARYNGDPPLGRSPGGL
jgi:hypothetical protein